MFNVRCAERSAVGSNDPSDRRIKNFRSFVSKNERGEYLSLRSMRVIVLHAHVMKLEDRKNQRAALAMKRRDKHTASGEITLAHDA